MVSRQYEEQLRHPERHAARKAVTRAVKGGYIRPATDHFCCDCGQPAEEYDHFLGYSDSFRMAVQPVCQSCHGKRMKLGDIKTCVVCATEFMTPWRRKFCSKACGELDLYRRSRVDVGCPGCGALVQVRHGESRRRFCSTDCRNRSTMKERNSVVRADGTWIASGRHALKLQQSQLAARLGITQSWLSQWERGVEIPKPEYEARLRELFNGHAKVAV